MSYNKPKKTLRNEEYLKIQKQQSRSAEAALTNSVLDILISEFNISITYQKTKTALKTVKMIIPTTMYDNGVSLTKETLISLSHTICQPEILSEDATTKQMKRNEEAQIANGMLALLVSKGFAFEEKKTRPCHKTTRLIRVSKLIDLNNNIEYNSKQLIERGTEFGKAIETLAKRRVERITSKNLKLSKDTFSELKDQLNLMKSGKETVLMDELNELNEMNVLNE